MPGDMHKGGCGCGAVRFELRGALRPVIFCHCDQCRRQSSHFLASSEVDDAMLTIDSGADDITWYRSSDFARRGFCRNLRIGIVLEAGWHHEDIGHGGELRPAYGPERAIPHLRLAEG